MARHKRRRKEKYGVAARQRGRKKGTYERCGSELLKKNMARHRETCGVELVRARKTCQYCREDLSEDYVKKHELIPRERQDERVVDWKTALGADRA